MPLPRDKLLGLTLVGGILAAGAAVALASPDLLTATSDALPPGAPADDPNFSPAVQQGGEHEEDDEHEWEWEAHLADEADER